jgi:hypothetical protein
MSTGCLGRDGDAALPSPWLTKIEVDPIGEDGHAYRADIYRNSIHLCRITLTWARSDEAGASRTLEGRVARWIADYETRDHSGDTQFQQL